MLETLSTTTQRARKPHRCNYCCEKIEKGEMYRRSHNKFDGRIYDWLSHLHCAEIASAIWDFADPDEGMTETTFQDCVQQVMDELYCPAHCPKWDEDNGCGKFDWSACLRKFAEFMKTHELVSERTELGMRAWRLREKKPEEAEGGGQDRRD